MKKFFQTLRNIWSIDDLRSKIIVTLSLIFVYRLGTFVVLPGIDPNKLSALSGAKSGALGLIDAFSGGAFSQASILALGIMPYISASIFMQLMTILIPQMQKVQKEGASGQKEDQSMDPLSDGYRHFRAGICLCHLSEKLGWCYPGVVQCLFLADHADRVDGGNPVCHVAG